MIKCCKTNCNQPASIVTHFQTAGKKYCINHIVLLKKQRKLQFAKFTCKEDIFDYLCTLRRLELLYHVEDSPKDCFDDLPKAIMNKLMANHEALWLFCNAMDVDPFEFYPTENMMPDVPVAKLINEALEKGYDIYNEVAKQMFGTIDPTTEQRKQAKSATFKALYNKPFGVNHA
jgi:hypothetical protein